MVAILAGLGAATIALNPAHGHAQARSCDFCQTAHLPFIQPSVTTITGDAAHISWHDLPELRLAPLQLSRIPSHSRAPPA